MSSDSAFTIPVHPERRFPSRGGVQYEGDTTFRLTPDQSEGQSLESLVEATLEAGPYRSGQFIELPMALWLVRDDETADVFRVSVRDGSVRLHVLPETRSAGLSRFYDRLVSASTTPWSVECRSTKA